MRWQSASARHSKQTNTRRRHDEEHPRKAVALSVLLHVGCWHARCSSSGLKLGHRTQDSVLAPPGTVMTQPLTLPTLSAERNNNNQQLTEIATDIGRGLRVTPFVA